LIAGFLVPESPVFLIKKNKLTKALESYRKIHSSKTAEAGLTALQIVIEKEVEAEKHKDGRNFLQCFRGSDWRRTRIIMYANVL
jgi:SP family general alpha glucoside:H+ symporter-like MFS transporter